MVTESIKNSSVEMQRVRDHAVAGSTIVKEDLRRGDTGKAIEAIAKHEGATQTGIIALLERHELRALLIDPEDRTELNPEFLKRTPKAALEALMSFIGPVEQGGK